MSVHIIANDLCSIAVPFLPPAQVYTPLEKVVEVVPDLGYQLYFADRKADTEIYNAVSVLYSPDQTSAHAE